VGRYVETEKGHTVNVRVTEEDGEDLVVVEAL
jgi:hypothetical protein